MQIVKEILEAVLSEGFSACHFPNPCQATPCHFFFEIPIVFLFFKLKPDHQHSITSTLAPGRTPQGI
jgi:hypothetical protein